MIAWNKKFDDLGITNLRSPIFFHLDPRDIDGWREFADREGRLCEVVEIRDVVGEGLSKYKRKKKSKDL